MKSLKQIRQEIKANIWAGNIPKENIFLSDERQDEAVKTFLQQFIFERDPLTPCSAYDDLNRVAGNRRVKSILADLEINKKQV